MSRPTNINGVAVPYGMPVSHLRELALAGSAESWAAFAALTHSPDAEAVDVLIEACDHRDSNVRRAAVEAIGHHESGRNATAAVERRLRDESELVRRAATVAAASLGTPGARDACHALRREPSPTSREMAVLALAAVWSDEDFEPLVKQFRTDPSDSVRKKIAWTLRNTATKQHAARLFELWRHDPVPRHRAWSCELAAEYPDQISREALGELTQDSDGHVRGRARRAMGIE